MTPIAMPPALVKVHEPASTLKLERQHGQRQYQVLQQTVIRLEARAVW